MKIQLAIEHPFKQRLRNEKIRLWQIRHCTGVPESSLSRYLNGIDPMPELLEKQIQDILNGSHETFEEKKNRVFEELTRLGDSGDKVGLVENLYATQCKGDKK